MVDSRKFDTALDTLDSAKRILGYFADGEPELFGVHRLIECAFNDLLEYEASCDLEEVKEKPELFAGTNKTLEELTITGEEV